MKLTNKIQKAIIASAILHKNQERKDNPIPFIIHPYSVAVVLSNYTDDEDIVVAGLLHDVLEDVRDYPIEEMKKEFGERVYEIVKGVSEDKDPNDENPDSVGSWEKRKNGYLDNLKKDAFEVMMVSCADKIHNLLSLQEAYKEQGEDLWKKFNAPEDKKIWFYGEVLNILKEKLKNPIVDELERVYKETQKIIEPEKLNYLEEKELEDEKMTDGLLRAVRRVAQEKRGKESKYIITLWESHFGYNDLWNNFSILDVCYEPEDANRRLKIFSDKVIIDGIFDKKIVDEKEYVEMEIADYKKKGPMMKVFSPANTQNKVVARIARAICSKTIPEYDKSYYYLEIVEFPKDTKIKPELFNPDRCGFEVRSFFEDTGKKFKLGMINWANEKTPPKALTPKDEKIMDEMVKELLESLNKGIEKSMKKRFKRKSA